MVLKPTWFSLCRPFQKSTAVAFSFTGDGHVIQEDAGPGWAGVGFRKGDQKLGPSQGESARL